MNLLFIAFFCLLPWSHLFFRGVDLWHGTGHFVQVGILILFCYSFFEKQKRYNVLNIPLGSFLLWTGIITSYYWIKGFSLTGNYPIKVFMPFFNILCVVILYKLIVEYLNKEIIYKILKYMKYSILLVLFYCVLQYLKLDEFLKGNGSGLLEMVGTIGHPSHLAGFLTIAQPLFFEKSRENILSLCLLWSVIIATGAASGIVFGGIILLFWLFFKNKKFTLIVGSLSVIATTVLWFFNRGLFSTSYRFLMWSNVFPYAKKKFVTGFGLGSFGLSNFNYAGAYWKHLHNEYYQIVFEVGLIGLILLFWIIIDSFKMFNKIKSDLSVRLFSIFLGCCLLALIDFNAHLWQMSMIGILSYAGLYCIKNEVEYENTVRN